MQHAIPRETCPTPLDAMIQRAGLTDARATTTLDPANDDPIPALAMAAEGPIRGLVRAMSHTDHPQAEKYRRIAGDLSLLADGVAA